MIADVFSEIAGVLFVIVAVILLPSSARCPAGWALGEGVRRTGEYACYSPAPHDCGEPRGPHERPCPPSIKRRGRIYCTGGSIPIVVDERTVGCQARH